MERRNTIQKNLVLSAVRSLKSHVTADEVYELIKSNFPNIGKGTVYRNLNILADEGSIKRVEIPDGPDRYDFTVTEHYHVLCVKCNSVSDVDMDIIPDIYERIRNNNGMKFLSNDILFKGICDACQKEAFE